MRQIRASSEPWRFWIVVENYNPNRALDTVDGRESIFQYRDVAVTYARNNGGRVMQCWVYNDAEHPNPAKSKKRKVKQR